MTIAIPTIKGEEIAKRFRDITEFTLLEIEQGIVLNTRKENVQLSHHHTHKAHSPHEEGHYGRRQEILGILHNCDELWYRSLCKNWRTRLQGHTLEMKRINEERLSLLKANLQPTAD